jgi:hypothetical protein
MTREKKLINSLIDRKIKETEEEIQRAYNSGDSTYTLYEILNVYEDLKDDINSIYSY